MLLGRMCHQVGELFFKFLLAVLRLSRMWTLWAAVVILGFHVDPVGRIHAFFLTDDVAR